MKITKLIIIFLIFTSCKTNDFVNDKNCNENKEFKKIFFSKINYIEKNIYSIQDEKFRNALKFLSNYVNVSFDKMSNYSNSYPDGVFEKDKKEWLRWYEENKCDNIRLKD